MKVYRFENAGGEGPFTDREAGLYAYRGAVEDERDDPSNMPGPLDEPETTGVHIHAWNKGFHGTPYRFGFASLDQMRLSFPTAKGRAAMHRKGMKLVVYEVPDEGVLMGTRQVVFLNTDGTKIATLGPTSLRPLKEKSAA